MNKKNIIDYNTPCRSIHKEKKKISPQIQKREKNLKEKL